MSTTPVDNKRRRAFEMNHAPTVNTWAEQADRDYAKLAAMTPEQRQARIDYYEAKRRDRLAREARRAGDNPTEAQAIARGLRDGTVSIDWNR